MGTDCCSTSQIPFSSCPLHQRLPHRPPPHRPGEPGANAEQETGAGNAANLGAASPIGPITDHHRDPLGAAPEAKALAPVITKLSFLKGVRGHQVAPWEPPSEPGKEHGALSTPTRCTSLPGPWLCRHRAGISREGLFVMKQGKEIGWCCQETHFSPKLSICAGARPRASPQPCPHHRPRPSPASSSSCGRVPAGPQSRQPPVGPKGLGSPAPAPRPGRAPGRAASPATKATDQPSDGQENRLTPSFAHKPRKCPNRGPFSPREKFCPRCRSSHHHPETRAERTDRVRLP